MIRSVIDQVSHEGAIAIIVAPALTVLLTQAGDIGGFVPSIMVVVIREAIGVCVKRTVKPKAGEKCEGCYW